MKMKTIQRLITILSILSLALLILFIYNRTFKDIIADLFFYFVTSIIGIILIFSLLLDSGQAPESDSPWYVKSIYNKFWSKRRRLVITMYVLIIAILFLSGELIMYRNISISLGDNSKIRSVNIRLDDGMSIESSLLKEPVKVGERLRLRLRTGTYLYYFENENDIVPLEPIIIRPIWYDIIDDYEIKIK